jgi:tetratricopeptide (TPR) repeat protein
MLGVAAHHAWASPLAPPELREQQRAEAKSLLARVIERRPDWSPPYYYLGQLFDMEGDPHAALEALQKSVALNPSFAPGYAQIGRVQTRLGQVDAALENINHAMALSPGDPAFPAWQVFAGLAEIERGHDAVALEQISRAAAQEPNNPFFQASLAAIYALTGDWRNADIHATRYRELTPTLTNEQRIAVFAGRWQPKRFATGARLALASIQ